MSESLSYEHPDEIACPGGPLLVRGDRFVEGPDGARHRTTRPVSAVCRCGHSADLPWCDGTHKVLPERSRP
ncbi:MAG: CDGSH iron-sulfur domain-containing protein [Nocardioides sp.]